MVFKKKPIVWVQKIHDFVPQNLLLKIDEDNTLRTFLPVVVVFEGQWFLEKIILFDEQRHNVLLNLGYCCM